MFPLDKHLIESGVPKRYVAARITDFAVGFELPGFNDSGLYLAGQAGRGKTHLATALLANAMEEHVNQTQVRLTVKWATIPELLLELRNSFNSQYVDVSEKSVLAKYSNPYLLVLDDLGAEKQTDWTGQSIYALISRRINDCRPTIVTSNFTLEEIHKSDPRLASRLGGMTYLRLEGDDRRLA